MDEDLSAAEAQRIAVEGYLYLYPLVTMELTRRQLTSGEGGSQPGRGPAGSFQHIRRYPTADFRSVVRPNFDTLYSPAWLDVSAEPMVVSVPESGSRYYLLPFYDMWTDVFCCPGTRTTGRAPVTVALCAPRWEGALPDGVLRVDAPTPVTWLIGRTQTNGPDDYPAVHRFQDQMSIVPLSAYGGGRVPPGGAYGAPEDPSVDATTPPLEQVNAMDAATFFGLAADLLRRHPPHLTDGAVLARLRRLGVVAGAPFDLGAQPARVQAAFDGVPQRALDDLLTRLPRMAPVVNGWLMLTESVGVYGNQYAKRAALSMVGLGANPPEDSVYPVLQTDAEGRPLDGANRYVLHFPADGLPPADAFWSVTVYDAAGFQVANELDRFALGDRDPLSYNPDGSLDLWLQPDRPDAERVPNWLPTPAGAVGITMRIYLPRPEVLSGRWSPPPVRRTG